MFMKKWLACMVTGLCICSVASASDMGYQRADGFWRVDMGTPLFTFQPFSHACFGFNILSNAPGELADNTGFFRMPQFSFNVVEFAFQPYNTGGLTLGVEVEWNWYHLNKYNLFSPYNTSPLFPEQNGRKVDVVPMGALGITQVNTSIFSVCTFSVPLTFNQRLFRNLNLKVGAALEFNLPGWVQFKGRKGTDNLHEMSTGTRFSNRIKTNLPTCNFHAAIGWREMGIFVKYRPMAVLADGFGPQFQTWTIGVMVGMGL